MCKNDVFVAKFCNCKIQCFLSRKFANARSALALRDIWRLPLARQLIAAWRGRVDHTILYSVHNSTNVGGVVVDNSVTIEVGVLGYDTF